jgi:sodium-dependent dicarboxylate transporter 2/3/5
VIGCTAVVAVYWITEALPLPATSLIPLFLLPMTGAAAIDKVAPSYGNPVVFMYMGGFVLALAIEKWNLHRRIALMIITAVGTSHNRIVLGIMIATCCLTLFISNAATALMMLPVALALITEIRDKQLLDAANAHRFAKCVLLAVAYTATIGGLATLVAAVPNALLSAIAREQLNHTVTFSQWLAFAGPISLLMLDFVYFYLTRFAFRMDRRAARRPISCARNCAISGRWEGKKRSSARSSSRRRFCGCSSRSSASAACTTAPSR